MFLRAFVVILSDSVCLCGESIFPPMGVPPVGHREAPVTLIDRDLLAFEEIWAAADTPNAVFRLKPEDLVAMTGGRIADVRQT